MKNIVAVVPVKASSERVKKKNTRKFYNSSLYELKLKQLSKCKNFDDIIISSESDKILNIAKKNNFSIHKRNKKYSTSKIPMSNVYKNIASEIKGDNIAWVNVTNPLVESEDYDKAVKFYKKMNKKKYDCLLSVFEIKDYFYYKNKRINFKNTPWQRSQDLKGLLSLSFAINILKRESMIKWRSCVGNKPFFYQLTQLKSWDIDSDHDFKFCEYIYKKKLHLK